MTTRESFGEQPLKQDTLLDTLNRVWLPILKKMREAQNNCDCEGGGGNEVTIGAEPSDPDDGDLWLEV